MWLNILGKVQSSSASCLPKISLYNPIRGKQALIIEREELAANGETWNDKTCWQLK